MKFFKIVFIVSSILLPLHSYSEGIAQKESADERWLKSTEHQNYVLSLKALDSAGLSIEKYKTSSIIVASCGSAATVVGAVGVLDGLPFASFLTKKLSGVLDDKEIRKKILDGDFGFLSGLLGLPGGLIADIGEDGFGNGYLYLSTGEFKKNGYFTGIKYAYVTTTYLAEKFFSESSACRKAWYKLKDIKDEEYSRHSQAEYAKIVERQAQEIRARWIAEKKQKLLNETQDASSVQSAANENQTSSIEAK